MSTHTDQGTARQTAKIYQFPVPSPRAAAADRNRRAEAAVEAMSQRICDALDNCWYHDAAIRQSTGSTKA
jgi:hypothetical protein